MARLNIETRKVNEDRTDAQRINDTNGTKTFTTIGKLRKKRKQERQNRKKGRR